MNDADYIVTTALHPDYLQIGAAGPYSSANSRHLVDRVAAEIETHAAQKVLVDCRQVMGYPSTISRFQDGAYIAARLKLTVKCALLVRTEMMMGRFTETVAVNRGANFAAFDNEDDALAWLLRN